jgi:hypothetical protein
VRRNPAGVCRRRAHLVDPARIAKPSERFMSNMCAISASGSDK